MIRHPSYQKDQSTRKKGFSVTYVRHVLKFSCTEKTTPRSFKTSDNSQVSSPATKTPSHTATPMAAKSYAGDFKKTRLDPEYRIILFSVLERPYLWFQTIKNLSGLVRDRLPMVQNTPHKLNQALHCIFI